MERNFKMKLDLKSYDNFKVEMLRVEDFKRKYQYLNSIVFQRNIQKALPR